MLFRNHQLIGDSQFVRFAEQIIFSCTIKNRKIQYCVSGQTTSDLYNLLNAGGSPIHNSVILMIGTNDLVKRKNLIQAKIMFERTVNLLRVKAERIVLFTLPPVALYEDDPTHWEMLYSLNNFILSFGNSNDVIVVDIMKKMLLKKFKVNLNFYEKVYGKSDKPDLIHLNREGFQVIKKLLDEDYFYFKV